MSQPKVSIIVPVYNVEKYIGRCIDSLKAQTLADIEIILVDDESPDSCPALCDAMSNEDPRIKVIHKKNEGAGKARNSALEIATGEYVGFVDSDDYVSSDMFETLYKKAKQYDSDLVMSGVLFVGGNMFSEDGECIRKNYFDKDTLFLDKESLTELRMGIIGSLPHDADDSKYGMSLWKNLFRREIIEQNGITFESEREKLSEDALFMVDFISCIKSALGINEAFYNYCRNDDSISKSYKKDRFEKSLVFVGEVEKRFGKDIPKKEYDPYINRFLQAMCRVICSQEIMHALEVGMKYKDLKKRLKQICTHEKTVAVFAEYPIEKLPIKQRIFAYALKYRMYFIMKLLVNLRSR